MRASLLGSSTIFSSNPVTSLSPVVACRSPIAGHILLPSVFFCSTSIFISQKAGGQTAEGEEPTGQA
jgi:hypothetical protein